MYPRKSGILPILSGFERTNEMYVVKIARSKAIAVLRGHRVTNETPVNMITRIRK